MPYRMPWELKGVLLDFSGHVTGAEIKNAGDDAYGHEGFDAVQYLIFDFTDALDVAMTLDDVKLLAVIDTAAAKSNPRIRQAIVSSSETVDVALSFYASSAPKLPWQTEGFRTLDEARSWLGS